jgi:hypothetical protein
VRLLVLLITILALTFGGSAAAGSPPELGGYSVTCSVTLRGAGCFVERPVMVFGSFEVSIGFDARAVWAGGERGYAAPYVVIGVYERAWAAWLEVALPDTRFPAFGKPDPFRFGVTYRF